MRRVFALGLLAALLLLNGCYDAADLGNRIFAINLPLSAVMRERLENGFLHSSIFSVRV